MAHPPVAPRIGSLCTGAGGLDLAVLAVFGGRLVWVAHVDRHAAALLAHRWPGLPNLGDIRAVDWQAVEPVDVLSAGFPCQPYSDAGRRRGPADDRDLWPAVATAVRDLRPGLVVLENVPGFARRHLGAVLGDLAECGYDTVWTRLSAADCGAAHRRDRWFALAWPACAADADGTRRRRPRTG